MYVFIYSCAFHMFAHVHLFPLFIHFNSCGNISLDASVWMFVKCVSCYKHLTLEAFMCLHPYPVLFWENAVADFSLLLLSEVVEVAFLFKNRHSVKTYWFVVIVLGVCDNSVSLLPTFFLIFPETVWKFSITVFSAERQRMRMKCRNTFKILIRSFEWQLRWSSIYIKNKGLRFF